MRCTAWWLIGVASLSCSALTLFSAAPCRAGDDKEPVEIRYRAPPACPSEGEMLAHLSARTTKMRPLHEGESGRRFELEVETTNEGARGKVTIASPDGSAVVRQIPGKTCEEVVAAMVLVAALAIDSRAALAPLPPPPEPPVAAPPVQAPPPPVVEAQPARPPPPVAPAPTERRAPGRRAVRFVIGASAIAALGIEPEIALGGGGFVGAEWRRPSFWSPSVRLAIATTMPSEARLELGSARFQWFEEHLDVCPLRFGSSAITARPCLFGEIGALTATGLDVRKGTRETRDWLAGGILGRIAARLFGDFALEAGAGLAFPLRRYDFILTPNTAVERSSAVGVRLDVGVSTLFP